MSRWYLDTSAAIKLVAEERESQALAAAIDSEQLDLVACCLLETELRRTVQRDHALTQEIVSGLLDGVSLFAMPAPLFRQAGLLPSASLRSLDALHLAAALAIGVEGIISYDRRMAGSARDLGLRVLAPV